MRALRFVGDPPGLYQPGIPLPPRVVWWKIFVFKGLAGVFSRK
jgi:hypothetical protein